MFKFIIFSLFLLPISYPGLANDYNRREWPHWSSVEGCKNTRAAMLISQSKVPVTYTSRKDGLNCTVATGKWDDYYYPETLTKASDVDIDHLVPLKHAHDSGGSNWPKELKRKFANDPDNLVITNKVYNRQKGAKTPLEWMPVDRSYACKYMKDWIKVKKKYSLNISQKELEHFKLLKCD